MAAAFGKPPWNQFWATSRIHPIYMTGQPDRPQAALAGILALAIIHMNARPLAFATQILFHRKGNIDMASYIDGALIKDEKVVYTGNISLWSLAPLIIIGSILLVLYGAGIILLLIAFIRYKTTELAITNKRVIAKFGFIARQTIELNINKVESIQVNQSIIGRIFNYGSLSISGAGNPQAPIPGISNPMGFRRVFMEIQDQASQTKSA
jgi:membrane protein YdbS with pleckstrin-like domain